VNILLPKHDILLMCNVDLIHCISSCERLIGQVLQKVVVWQYTATTVHT